MSGKIDKGKR